MSLPSSLKVDGEAQDGCGAVIVVDSEAEGARVLLMSLVALRGCGRLLYAMGGRTVYPLFLDAVGDCDRADEPPTAPQQPLHATYRSLQRCTRTGPWHLYKSYATIQMAHILNFLNEFL